MRELVAYRVRLYPTREQILLLVRTVGCCRLLYNLALEQRAMFARPGRRIGWVSQANELKSLKADLPFLAEVPHHALQQALVDLDRAFVNFFEGRAGFPRPRSRWRRDSFRLPDPSQIKVRGDRLFLPKAKWVAARLHQPIEGRLKSVTVVREGGHWYASLLVDRKVRPLADVAAKACTGIDVGVAQPLKMSDGTMIALPRVSETERRRMARLQRELARRTVRGKPSSKQRRRTQEKIARLQARWARRRKEALRQAAAAIFSDNDLVAMEALQVKAMTGSAKGSVEEPGRNVRQKAGLNRSLLDIAPGAIRRTLETKAASLRRRGRNTRVVAVPPQYTSQTCSACGFHPRNDDAPQGLEHGRLTRDRFQCPVCAYQANADVNAARNILRLALAMEAANTVGAPAALPAAGPAVAARGAIATRQAMKREQRSDRCAA